MRSGARPATALVYHGTRTLPRVASLDLLDRWLHAGDVHLRSRAAIVDRDAGSWSPASYAELDARSAAVATALQGAGVQPGDRVLLLGSPGSRWAASFLGTLRRGAIVVPLDPKLAPAELAALARRSAPAAVLVSHDQRPRWDLVAAHHPDLPVVPAELPADGRADPGRSFSVRASSDPAVVVWTSGTTGAPKGATISFANLSYVVDAAASAQAIDGEDRWLSVLPPNHLLELCCGLLPALATGATTFVAATVLPAELLALLAECRATRTVTVPVLLRALRRQVEGGRQRSGGSVEEAVGSLGELRGIYCGGAPLDPATEAFLRDAGLALFPGYGLSEASPTVTMNRPGADRSGSVGQPLAGTEVTMTIEREILVRGPGVMLGYWADAAATSATIDGEGWLHTGDLGHLDDDGFLFVTGRSKSLIVLESGKKVQPEEVEAALVASGRFADVCVVGRRDPASGGEQVCAVVVSTTAIDDDGLEDDVRQATSGLAGYKRPTVVMGHPGPLPATTKASVRRRDVLALVESRLAGSGGRPPRSE